MTASTKLRNAAIPVERTGVTELEYVMGMLLELNLVQMDHVDQVPPAYEPLANLLSSLSTHPYAHLTHPHALVVHKAVSEV